MALVRNSGPVPTENPVRPRAIHKQDRALNPSYAQVCDHLE
jgi:hypothetical protein